MNLLKKELFALAGEITGIIFPFHNLGLDDHDSYYKSQWKPEPRAQRAQYDLATSGSQSDEAVMLNLFNSGLLLNKWKLFAGVFCVWFEGKKILNH